MMNIKSRQEVSFACFLVWILGTAGFSHARPSTGEQQPIVSSQLTTVASSSSSSSDGNVPSSFVVPQVGFLEERSNDDKAADNNGGNSGNGILLPIVSVIDGDSPKSEANGGGGLGVNGNNPLVALLPAPSAIGQAPDSKTNPIITTLPIVPYDQDQSLKPEIRKSRSEYAETMDVAEDIVFRPLFRIRPNKNSYTTRYLRRNNRPNYQRYNVNGYYRLPYNYFTNNNYNRKR